MCVSTSEKLLFPRSGICWLIVLLNVGLVPSQPKALESLSYLSRFLREGKHLLKLGKVRTLDRFHHRSHQPVRLMHMPEKNAFPPLGYIPLLHQDTVQGSPLATGRGASPGASCSHH